MSTGRELRKRQAPDYESLLAAYHHLEAAHIRLKKRHRDLTEKVSELIRRRYEEKSCVVWNGMLLAGIHPAIAGVIMGLITPVSFPKATRDPLLRALTALEEFGLRQG